MDLTSDEDCLAGEGWENGFCPPARVAWPEVSSNSDKGCLRRSKSERKMLTHLRRGAPDRRTAIHSWLGRYSHDRL